MRVLHVSESLVGGPASYLEEILPHQVAMFARDDVILLAPEEHRDHVAKQFSGVVEFYRRRRRDAGSLLSLAKALRRVVRQYRPDIIHLHSSFAGGIGRLSAIAMRPRPLIVYCAHCWSFDRTPPSSTSYLWQSTEWLLSHLTDRIINLSPHEQPLLAKAGFRQSKISLIVTGLADLGPDQVAPLSPRQPGTPLRLLFLGRTDRQKGADLLLREWDRIDPARARLTLAGGRVLEGPDLVVPPAVTMLGWVPRASIPRLLQDCDAVLMPSRWEGMPIAAIEVLRAGRPLLSSDRGVFPYFIQTGINGVLMDIDRPGFLDRALTVLEASDLGAMGRAARATYQACFQQERMNRELVELYREMLGVRRPTGGPYFLASGRQRVASSLRNLLSASGRSSDR